MTTRVLICDDSSFARKQIAKSLPDDWELEISYAKNGIEGLQALKAGKGELLFLDLNMPEMDGYQVLQTIQNEKIATLAIVISGDIQPEAQKRVMDLGALEFIKKPVDKTEIYKILVEKNVQGKLVTPNEHAINEDLRDGCKEIANVAIGQAANLLAHVLNAFIIMPLPNVNMIEVSELRMALNQVAESDAVSAVCQGFIGSGVAGEALLIFNDSSFADIAELMNYEGVKDEAIELELLMDIASIINGACLKGVSDQLDISFSQSHPTVLGRHITLEDLIKRSSMRWKRTLTIEMAISIENRNINCNLLLLFTEDSIYKLNEFISYLTDD